MFNPWYWSAIMKTLRLALAALVLLAACDTADPVSPPPAPRFDSGQGTSSTTCDSACLAKSPYMGGGGG